MSLPTAFFYVLTIVVWTIASSQSSSASYLASEVPSSKINPFRKLLLLIFLLRALPPALLPPYIHLKLKLELVPPQGDSLPCPRLLLCGPHFSPKCFPFSFIPWLRLLPVFRLQGARDLNFIQHLDPALGMTPCFTGFLGSLELPFLKPRPWLKPLLPCPPNI